jgi:hypothetical protein
VTAWNPDRIATFDYLRYVEAGVERRLSFDEFRDLPLGERVKVLLVGKPRFFLGNVEIPKARALARRRSESESGNQ